MLDVVVEVDEAEGEEEKEKSSKKGGKELSEEAVRDILEAVERVMCSLFYDR